MSHGSRAEASPSSWRRRLERLDQAVFRGERWVVGAAFLAMALVVFADVVHRIFTRVPGRLASILAALLGGLGVEVSAAALDDTVAPALILVTAYVAAYGACRSRTPDAGKQPMPRHRAAVVALLCTLGGTLALQLALRLRPDGLVWAPYFGLAMLLYVGLIGASMATYAGRHLALEMGERLWPERARPQVRAVAQGLAAALSLLIASLAALSLSDHFTAWSANPQAALVPALELPKWLVFAVVPYAFFMMSWRFFGRMTGLLPPPPPAELPA